MTARFLALLLLLLFGSLVSSRVCLVESTDTSTSWSSGADDSTSYMAPLPSVGSRPISWMMKKRWPDKTIPVTIVDSYPQEFRPRVYAAMDAINKLTCLRLTNGTTATMYSLRVVWGKRACFSHVGYKKYLPGYQEINLYPTCLYEGLGTAIHEFIHAIGFHHKQVRPDRDKYVTVHKDRIDQKRFYNFKKMKGKYAYLATFGLPYDYNSVMQYPKDAFGTGKGPVITLNQNFPGYLGETSGPSRADIADINRMYECRDHYLGDDIPGAILYSEFHRGYMARKPKFSKALWRWNRKMRKFA
ncbi:high choriolytic enzyme 1-like [Panulirus ornatus]|uniref:high choriolytic enzyme 1-like n=1 Tax=Panulirus ornatus TaxID=150431 RepID=UPI003A897ACA